MQETNYYSEENQFAIQALKCFSYEIRNKTLSTLFAL
jgi:hypothetical protein